MRKKTKKHHSLINGKERKNDAKNRCEESIGILIAEGEYWIADETFWMYAVYKL